MSDPVTGGKPQIDPFGHVVDSAHIQIFEGTELGFPDPISKYIVFLALAALVVGVMILWVANKIQSGQPPKGKLWNLIESLIFFVRDKIARPGLGIEDGDKFLPFLSTLFLFIFVCNLFGMFPFLPSPTAHIYVTGALAVVSFGVIHTIGIRENGLGGYLKTFIPHIHMEGGLGMRLFGFVLMFGMAILEYLTAFIRVIILAVRLFANMLAGHTVLFMILFFIKMVADPVYKIDIAQDWMFWPVSIFSVLMVTALSLLELFIAGLQAFIFTFLTAIFIGLAKHPPH
ncbi:F0F1 ATP synthase subunit A [Fimbriiglobus ruber]|uniref:ATP synthase subunit a n=1 Tax=Fimbriiglobus ruber TaxID=1908690 RepID=A0A225ECS6_9BACT|nr:F0F1 ATP synthase subunit A [Fimbriiglobus ruber]OWK47149.1 ATP synthase F0 sector subunit a [Fimbriiglobus ruber]